MSDRAVFVTGATGFLGEYVVRALARGGRAVHALARPGADRSRLADVDVRWHAGDVLDPASLERALARVPPGAAAVHAAAYISYRSRDRERMRATNVEGTWNVLAACRARGVAPVVHVSSIVAVGAAPPGVEMTEDFEFNLEHSTIAYVRTKRAAEDVALGMTGELDVRAVCPAAIFGSSARGSNTAEFLARLARGIGPIAPPGALAVVGAQDVAAGIVAALERGRPGRRYLLVESWHTVLALSRLCARRLGARGPRWRCPRFAWRLVEALAVGLDRLHPLELATPQALAMVGLSFAARADRARDELGWRPRPFREVLDEAVGALERAGRTGI